MSVVRAAGNPEPWPGCRMVTVDITPSRLLPLAGYASRSEPATSFDSTLEANVIVTAVDDLPLLIIAMDTLFGSEAVRDALVEALADDLPGLFRERVQLIASHTHFAPSLDPEKPRLGTCDSGYLDYCVAQIVAGIRVRLDQPSSVATTFKAGRALCRANVYRRLTTWLRVRRSFRYRRSVAAAPNRSVAIDHDLRLVRVSDERDRVQCLLWSWPCHAVSGGDRQAVSADFPGAVRDTLREHYGAGLPVLYFPGFSGDIRPYSRREQRTFREWLSMPLARSFDKPTPGAFKKLLVSLARAVRQADAALSTLPRDAGRPIAFSTRSLALSELIDGLEPGEERRLEQVSISLPPLRMEFWNAEVCSGYGSVPVPDGLFQTGCANAVHGYLPTDTQIAEGGYEVEEFGPLFGLQGTYRSDAERRVHAGLQTPGNDVHARAGEER